MPYYEAAALTTLNTAGLNFVFASFRAGAKRALLRELHLWCQVAPSGSGQIYIARSTAAGTGALTEVLGSARDPDPSLPAAGGGIVTAWATTKPTVAGVAAALRRLTTTATIGQGIVWTWYEDAGLVIPDNTQANCELCLVGNNASFTPGTWSVGAVFEE